MRVFRGLSIRRKLTLIIMLTSCVALLLASVAFVIYDRITFRRAMARDLTVLANVIGTNSAASLTFNDPKSAQEVLGALSAEPHVIAACIYTHGGKAFATYLPGGAKKEDLLPPEPQAEGSRFEADHLVLSRQIIFDGEIIGTVHLVSDLREMHARLERQIYIVLVILLGAALVVFLLSIKLQRVISGPILDLAQTAK